MSDRLYSQSANIGLSLEEANIEGLFLRAIDVLEKIPAAAAVIPTDWERTQDSLKDRETNSENPKKGIRALYDLADAMDSDEPEPKEVFKLTKSIIDNLGYKVKKESMKEGLADLAQMAEQDHEVQMARADLYKIAKYAIKLHDMLKGVSETQGLEGWQQAKITKASDYISAVYHNLDYDMKFNGAGELGEGKSPHKKGSKKYKKHMAAKHASMAESPYKKSISKRLQESVKKQTTKGKK